MFFVGEPMHKYIHKPEGIDAMLTLAGLAAHWDPIKYHNGARISKSGCWHVSFANVYFSGTTEHMTGDESFESWVAVIQKMCRKREEMKESRS